MMNMVSSEWVANLLGAFALAAADRIEVVTRNERLGARAAAALLHVERNPGGTQESLMAVLGLSQPGTAHLVKRLEADGLLRREPGRDARTRTMTLTTEGATAARYVLDRRLAVLVRLVEQLPAGQRETLAEVFPALLEPLVEERGDVARICRLCDLSGCEQAGPCPVATAGERVSDGHE